MGQPVTRRAYRRNGAQRASVVGTGVGLWAVTGVVLEFVPDTSGAPVRILCLSLVAAGAVAVAGGLAALAGWGRMGWVLRTHAWTAWDCPEPPVPGSAPRGRAHVRLGPDGEYRLLLSAEGWRQEWFADARTVWLAGSPQRGGVLSPDNGRHLVLVRPATGH